MIALLLNRFSAVLAIGLFVACTGDCLGAAVAREQVMEVLKACKTEKSKCSEGTCNSVLGAIKDVAETCQYNPETWERKTLLGVLRKYNPETCEKEARTIMCPGNKPANNCCVDVNLGAGRMTDLAPKLEDTSNQNTPKQAGKAIVEGFKRSLVGQVVGPMAGNSVANRAAQTPPPPRKGAVYTQNADGTRTCIQGCS